MNISIKKIITILKFKSKRILHIGPAWIGSILGIGFTFLHHDSLVEDVNTAYSFSINTGVIFSTLVTGCLVSAFLLAEEKEKHTLRIITSSVNNAEFFIGTFLPVFILAEAVNICILLISNVDSINIFMYLIVTSGSVLITILLGGAVGVLRNTQMSAGMTLVLPIVILMTLTMSTYVTDTNWIHWLSNLTYIGAMARIIDSLILNMKPDNVFHNLLVFGLWLVGAIIFFMVSYRKKRNLFIPAK